jgi:hypothetical protein
MSAAGADGKARNSRADRTEFCEESLKKRLHSVDAVPIELAEAENVCCSKVY